MSKIIADNFKKTDHKLNPVIKYNTKCYTDTVNEKVYLADYQVMIMNFIKYCEEHKRVPAYITTVKSKTKVSFELYLYCLSKIIVYYQNNNTLPNYCLFNKSDIQNTKSNNPNNNKSANSSTSNCTNPYKSVPYNSKQGCDAMGQNTSYYCGVSALQKVLYKFGINVSQKTLAEVSGTTTNGVGHQGLRTAIAWVSKKYNVKLSVQEYNFSDLGIEKIAKLICKPNVDAIWHLSYRNRYGHYEKVKSINLKTNTLEVINSLGTKCTNTCYCGYIETRSLAVQKQYINGISQKSIILITKES